MYCTKVPNLPPHNFEVNWGPPSTVVGGGVGMRSFLLSFSKRCHRVVESFWPFTPFASLLSVATHSYYLHLLDSVWWELVKGFLFSTSLSAMCLYPSLTYFTSFSSRWRSLPFAAAATNVWAYLGKSRRYTSPPLLCLPLKRQSFIMWSQKRGPMRKVAPLQ